MRRKLSLSSRNVDERPLVNITEPDGERFDAALYTDSLVQSLGCSQVGYARPLLINSTNTEIELAKGSVLVQED